MENKHKKITDKQINWFYAITIIVIPFVVVRLFPDPITSRLFSILWVWTIFPILIGFLVFYTKETIRFKNYSNPTVEKRITIGVKVLTSVMALICLWFFTLPIWLGAYGLYVQNEPPILLQDSVSQVTTPFFGFGIVSNLKLSQDSENSYVYMFPTFFRFADSKFKFTILPGTHFILNVESR